MTSLTLTSLKSTEKKIACAFLTDRRLLFIIGNIATTSIAITITTTITIVTVSSHPQIKRVGARVRDLASDVGDLMQSLQVCPALSSSAS